jgi:hypothetical protein
LEFDIPLNLDGNEFLTTYFSPVDESIMILALGDNINGDKEGPSTVFLYMCIDGEVEYGIESFVFFDSEKVWEFLNNIPEMSALDFMALSIGIRPSLY